MTVPSSPGRTSKARLLQRVKVQPNASRTAVLGKIRLADGETAVALVVTAPPEDGRANRAVAELVAEALKIPKSTIRVVTGATSKIKLLEIGADNASAAAIRTWIQALPDL